MKGHGMLADGDSGAGEVGDQALFDRHLLQRGCRRILPAELIQQRPGRTAGILHLPERIAAMVAAFIGPAQ